ncbi:MAG: YibE/F family protein, partial [Nocardioidaceae bacterium]
LAYVGATLPLLLVFTALEVEFSAAISQELVAQEVVRGLVGAIGILSAVPITTALAAAVAGTLAAQRRSTATPQPQDADRPGTPQDPGVDRRAPGHRRRR